MGAKTSKPDSVVLLTFFGVDFEQQVKTLGHIQEAYGMKEMPWEGGLTNISKNSMDCGFIWWKSFGRCIMRPIVMEYFSSAEVLILVLSPNKKIFNNKFFRQEIYEIVSNPKLSAVTVLVVVASEDCDVEKRLSADEVEQELQKTSLMFPRQDWHFMESPTMSKEVMGEIIRLTESRWKEKEVVKDKLTTRPSTGRKMGKMWNKFINVWKSTLSY